MSSVETPFQEEVVREKYFPGKEFEAILSQIQQTLPQQSTLMVLTGDEGVGKTTLCMQLVDAGRGYDTVFFPDTVESFGEVVLRIADALNLSKKEGTEIDVIVEDIIVALSERTGQVLLVFDQAESLYLATLERIRRLFGRFCDAEIAMHVLFSGRSAFLASYEQLAICNFPEIPEKVFSLPPLSLMETESYLFHSVSGNTELAAFAEAAFDKEFIHHLFQVTSGNLRGINAIARRRLKHSGSASSFLALLQGTASGKEPASKNGGMLDRWRQQLLDSLSSLVDMWHRVPHAYRKRAPLALGGAVSLILLVLLMPEQQPEKIVTEKTVEVAPEQKSKSPVEQELSHDGKVAAEQHVSVVSPPKIDVAEKTNITSAIVPKQSMKEEGDRRDVAGLADVQKAAPPVLVPKAKKEFEVHQEEQVDVPLVILPEHNKLIHHDIAEDEEEDIQTDFTEKEHVLEAEEKIVVLYPSEKSKYRDHVEATPFPDGKVTELERLVQNRFVAGMSWRSGSKDQLYTIQLAQLQGGDAMSRLNEFFTVPRYRPLVTDFYLFSKGLNPESVLVYYGEFTDEETATRALERISQKFSGYTPFVIAIKSAMTGIRTTH